MSADNQSSGRDKSVRGSNRDALNGFAEKDIGLNELDGFQLPVDVTREFITRIQESADLLGSVDTRMLDRLEEEVPKFGVPMLSGNTRDEEGTRTEGSTAESGNVHFNATNQQYYILVEPNRDALKNTHQGEGFGDFIINQFIERFGNDIELIGMRAGAASGNLQSVGGSAALDETWDGWIALAEGADTDSERIGLEGTAEGDLNTMPTFDNQDGGSAAPVDTDMFNGAIQTLDDRFRDPNNVRFYVSPSHVQQYHYDLTAREDGLGVAVLQGSSDVTPFEYDVVGVPGWPQEYGMLVDPNNLAYGLFRDVEVEQTRDTDKVHENRLHSRNWMEVQMDYQIKKMQAGVLITGLADPLA